MSTTESDPGGEDELRRTALAGLLKAERAARSAAEQAELWLEPVRTAAGMALTVASLDAVLRGALESLAALLDGDAAAVLLADASGRQLVARAAIGMPRDIDLDVRIAAGQGVAGQILGSRKPQIFPDLSKVEIASPVLRDSGLRSLAAVPLEAGPDIVGVLHVSSRRLDAFEPHDLEILELVAEPLAAAIERVRLFEAERAARLDAEFALTRLAGLQRITAALAQATSAAEVCQVILEQASVGSADAEHSQRGIWMLRRGQLLLVAGGARAQGFPVISLDESMPANSSLRTGEPLFLEDLDAISRRWPVLADSGARAFAALPLSTAGRVLGVMAVGFSVDHGFDDAERAFLIAVAEQASLALDRALAREEEVAQQERQSVLTDAALALSKPHVAPEDMLRELAEIATPKLADRATVMLVQRGRLERVAASSRAGSGEGAASGPTTGEVALDEQAARVARTRRPVILTGAGGAVQGTMVVPLVSHGRSIGVMTFETLGHHPPYEQADLELATQLAERTSAAADDVIARGRDRALAAALTRVLLPTNLPTVAGFEFAARYVPADAGQVGGDWYDAFELPDGRIGIVIGDVAGHGVEAASTMGRLRNAVFAYAREGHEPQVLFEHLAALLADPAGEWESTDPLATVLYATVGRSRREIVTACAGHPPWLLVRAGQAEYARCRGRVLAPGVPAQTEVVAAPLRTGDILLFFTDGLIERPGEPFEDGLTRLARVAQEVVASTGGSKLEMLCDAILDGTAPPGGRRDDCCLLALRVDTAA